MARAEHENSKARGQDSQSGSDRQEEGVENIISAVLILVEENIDMYNGKANEN
jgi:hypothetical protein